MHPTRTPPEVARLPQYAMQQEMEHHAAPHKQPFHNSHNKLGSLIHFASALAPLVIGELVHDPQKRWRWIRISALVCAGVSGVALHKSWGERVNEERMPDQERGR